MPVTHAREALYHDADRARGQGSAKSSTRALTCADATVETMQSGAPMCLCRWQRDRADALTWQGAERSPCRQGATRAAQGPDPGLCLPSPQVRPHVTDFADPLGTGDEDGVQLQGSPGVAGPCVKE